MFKFEKVKEVGDLTDLSKITNEINESFAKLRELKCRKHPEHTIVALSLSGEGLCPICAFVEEEK